ncbi:MAG TPA: MFS transporter, partial [Candidatus Methylomirabilis sp.]|nr:MFS transporter [Candidatus Methylomirabilis sp.]
MSGPHGALALLFGVNLLNYIDRQILYAVFPPIQTELGLSDTQLGLLASAFMWVYLSMAPIFGLLADRRSRPRLMAFGVGIWSVATAFSGVVRHFGDLLLGRAVVGVGEASYGAVAPAMLSDHFPPAKRGRMLAVFSMAIPVGSALGYLLGGVLEQTLGWRAAFFVVGLPGLLLAWKVGALSEPVRGGLDGVIRPTGRPARPGAGEYFELLRTPSYVL